MLEISSLYLFLKKNFMYNQRNFSYWQKTDFLPNLAAI